MKMNMLKEGTIKRIHVNKHVIASNRVHGKRRKPITIQTSKGPFVAHEVVINGPSRIIHSPEKPLSCGAKVWIETLSEVSFAV